MNVLFISECEGNALKETRRVLDQFAERRGERTWQTAITKDGLDTVRKLLRKTARKNTAVACHWIRGIDNTELVWIVGKLSKFNSKGAVPTNSTSRKLLRAKSENGWQSQRDLYLLTGLSALMHDLGKASLSFQERLKKPGLKERNLYRHEWVSLCIFGQFVGKDSDEGWLNRLANLKCSELSSWIPTLELSNESLMTFRPFDGMPPLAQAVGWLILTHHRLPYNRAEKSLTVQYETLNQLPQNITATWNEAPPDSSASDAKDYWTFPMGLPVTTERWIQRSSKLAKKLISRLADYAIKKPISDPYVMHLARMSLMIADHYYSSLTGEGRVKGEANYPLFANTRKTLRDSLGKDQDMPAYEPNQPLDEHLLGVEEYSRKVVFALPAIAEELPRIARNKKLRERSTNENFRWQNLATELAESIQDSAENHGAFIVNLASTGCGKTIANAKIMYALSNPNKGMRCAFALGLRTLTRQTGKEYMTRLGLAEDEVAILTGGAASQELSEYLEEKAAELGSESLQEISPETDYVIYDGAVSDEPIFANVMNERSAKKLISAPILTCTIDHIVPATESLKGGKQILPMLRLLSSDLVLDELDDYDVKDLAAVARLVNWAGMLGCKVLISSATLPPSLVQGIFDAYLDGRKIFLKNRCSDPAAFEEVCAVWVDEFDSRSIKCSTTADFMKTHNDFVGKRAQALSKLQPRRLAQITEIAPMGVSDKDISKELAKTILHTSISLHERHSQKDSVSGKQVSFGLVRLANISPLFETALELRKMETPTDFTFHLCVYHSQHPLCTRSEIESILDKTLNRKNPAKALEYVRHEIEQTTTTHHVFIVLSSPIAEVGRDHDYDWAIIEPSSMRSIIQIAGRVKRHRKETCTSPNMAIFSTNIRGILKNEIAYYRPGFETEEYKLRSKQLVDLLRPEDLPAVSSKPRIIEPTELKPRSYLVDLEHTRIRNLLVNSDECLEPANAPKVKKSPTIYGHSWWTIPNSKLGGVLQVKQRFRESTGEEMELVFLPDEDEQKLDLYQIKREKNQKSRKILKDKLIKEPEQNGQANNSFRVWATRSLMVILEDLSNDLDMTLEECAERFAVVSLREDRDCKDGWLYEGALGFSRYKEKLF